MATPDPAGPSTPAHSAHATDVADRLHSLAIHLLRRVRQEDAIGPITPAQSSALSVIVYAGPLTVGQLARSEQVRSPTMTRIVDQLAQQALVEREPVADDARRTRVRATASGTRFIVEGREKRVTFLARRLHDLSPAELTTIRQAVDLVAEAIETPHHR